MRNYLILLVICVFSLNVFCQSEDPRMSAVGEIHHEKILGSAERVDNTYENRMYMLREIDSLILDTQRYIKNDIGGKELAELGLWVEKIAGEFAEEAGLVAANIDPEISASCRGVAFISVSYEAFEDRLAGFGYKRAGNEPRNLMAFESNLRVLAQQSCPSVNESEYDETIAFEPADLSLEEDVECLGNVCNGIVAE
ncbi:MAG: hypothetical protein HOE90_21260 [Bacteriovoracaceae bacterium]|jgi:hypothetical protein|nr:hypothetical protein [Bacteriovoracaceae bacterium]